MNELMDLEKLKICVVGLGYVGLPLAVEFGKKFNTIGYDTNRNRIKKLSSGVDDTMEICAAELGESKHLKFSSSATDLASSNVYIVTVPTPIDKNNDPDLFLLKSASKNRPIFNNWKYRYL